MCVVVVVDVFGDVFGDVGEGEDVNVDEEEEEEEEEGEEGEEGVEEEGGNKRCLPL